MKYAKEAIDTFHRMTALMVAPDQDTYICLLKACATIGDVKTAYDAIKVLLKKQKP